VKEVDLETLKPKWEALKNKLALMFDHEVPDLNVVLFLIGVQELGKGYSKFSKSDKMDLVHIAICRLLSSYGYYTLKGHNQDGWPIWEMQENLPFLSKQQQEYVLRQGAVEYFEELEII
jgi:hypothetical protein